jgi:Flp pilus assembly protein TadG
MNQRGQVSVLVIGLTVTCLAIAGLATDATRAFIARRSLQNIADSAALAGAGELDVETYYSSGGSRIVTEKEDAAAVVSEWLRRRGYTGAAQIVVDRDSIGVTLRTDVPTSFLRLVGVVSLPVSAEADAVLGPGSIPGE